MISQQEEQQDTEIVLGTGKMLAIFFGLVILCGTFFGLGYSVGHSSSPMAIQTGQSGKTSASAGAKPLAGVTVSTPLATPQGTTPISANNPNSAAAAPVDQTPNAIQSSTAADPSAASPAGVVPVSAQANSNPSATSAPDGGAITVQVAAVTKQEDAQALADALRRKNYPVFVSSTNAADNLYHVQVGPFAELKDAETMKSKLAGDGYNAIVKK
ncbi:MAG TPA: SPOR domain-containing protein [Terriglobales bacterium]|nr:SPOR domain-containing protein [Terriglobales bacterium]